MIVFILNSIIVFILNSIFCIITTLSTLITRLIFSTTAYLLVLIIQAFKVPSEAIHGALEQLGGLIKACIESLLQVLMEAIGSMISSGFDLLKEALTESIAVTGSTMGGLAEITRNSLDEVIKSLPEILDGFSEMLSTIVKDLWDNYKDALGYVTQNV